MLNNCEHRSKQLGMIESAINEYKPVDPLRKGSCGNKI